MTSSSHRLRQRCRMTRFLNGMPSLPLMATVAGSQCSSSSSQSSASPAASLLPMSRNTGMSSAPSRQPAHVTTRYRRFGSNASPNTASTRHDDSSAGSIASTSRPAAVPEAPPRPPAPDDSDDDSGRFRRRLRRLRRLRGLFRRLRRRARHRDARVPLEVPTPAPARAGHARAPPRRRRSPPRAPSRTSRA